MSYKIANFMRGMTPEEEIARLLSSISETHFACAFFREYQEHSSAQPRSQVYRAGQLRTALSFAPQTPVAAWTAATIAEISCAIAEHGYSEAYQGKLYGILRRYAAWLATTQRSPHLIAKDIPGRPRTAPPASRVTPDDLYTEQQVRRIIEHAAGISCGHVLWSAAGMAGRRRTHLSRRVCVSPAAQERETEPTTPLSPDMGIYSCSSQKSRVRSREVPYPSPPPLKGYADGCSQSQREGSGKDRMGNTELDHAAGLYTPRKKRDCNHDEAGRTDLNTQIDFLKYDAEFRKYRTTSEIQGVTGSDKIPRDGVSFFP